MAGAGTMKRPIGPGRGGGNDGHGGSSGSRWACGEAAVAGESHQSPKLAVAGAWLQRDPPAPAAGEATGAAVCEEEGKE